ncbi:hypothetical protein AB9K41_27475 [Cribrihabitans sp. XS_ASV171]
MYAFATGAVLAALLAAGTWIVLDNSAISARERADNPSVLLGIEGIDLTRNEALETQ